MNTSDHFERLGLPRRFSVDPAAIESEYLSRSREVHPDFHSLGTPAEQRNSLELTAALNEAYVTLRDPTRRAEYLLKLLGGPSAQQEKNLDQEFLMEMLELRERIELVRQSPATNSAERNELNRDLHQRESDLHEKIRLDFVRIETASPYSEARTADLVSIRHSLNALRTIHSLMRDLDAD